MEGQLLPLHAPTALGVSEARPLPWGRLCTGLPHLGKLARAAPGSRGQAERMAPWPCGAASLPERRCRAPRSRAPRTGWRQDCWRAEHALQRACCERGPLPPPQRGTSKRGTRAGRLKKNRPKQGETRFRHRFYGPAGCKANGQL